MEKNKYRPPLGEKLTGYAIRSFHKILTDAQIYGPLSDEFTAAVASGAVKRARKSVEHIRQHVVQNGIVPTETKTQADRLYADLAHIIHPTHSSGAEDSSHK